ncbi:MAG: hypothetical protein ACRDBY_08630 [Cetobacterium sp.]
MKRREVLIKDNRVYLSYCTICNEVDNLIIVTYDDGESDLYCKECLLKVNCIRKTIGLEEFNGKEYLCANTSF